MINEYTGVNSEVAALPDLDGKYQVVKRLGAGANDVAYLIKDGDSQVAVALTPIVTANDHGWDKTQGKSYQSEKLKEDGLGDYIINALGKGRLTVDGVRKKVLVMEFAGADISNVATEPEKIAVIKQIVEIVFAFHDKNYTINDFKDDHWCFKSSAETGFKVRLIDYSQVRKEDPNNTVSSWLGSSDMYQLFFLIKDWFPWYDYSGYTSQAVETAASFKAYIQQILAEIESQAAEYSEPRKKVLRIRNKLRSMMTALKQW